MRIVYVSISNYRNLNGLDVFLSPKNNFIVGENNLGKSNFLLLLHTLFVRKSFHKDDFTDAQLPIEITFTLELEEIEIGQFDDFFEPTNLNQITIKAIQGTSEDPIDFWHESTNTRIPPSLVKCINFVYYDSVRNPSSELTFSKSKGVGKFLHHIIVKHLEESGETDSDFVDATKTGNLATYINSLIVKIKAFKTYAVNAQVEENVENLLSRIFTLKDSNGRYIYESGSGVQFLAIITLSILQKILDTMELKRDRGIFEFKETEDEDAEVKRAISIVIGFDEPEIHLHPYLQRSLVKYINRLLSNEENDFQELIETIFNLNKLIGQSIIATHSPNIILNDYTEIIRFYKNNGTVAIKSGSQLTLDHRLRKQLLMQLPFIKEAFFARSVIVVEGDSEIGAFPGFAMNTGEFDFDELGISVIKAGGKESVKPIIDLLGEFDIPAIGIKDRDNDPPSTNPKIMQTAQRDFEVEIINLITVGKEDSLKAILVEYDSQGAERGLDFKRLEKVQQKYDQYIDQSISLDPNNRLQLSTIADDDIECKKLWYLTWFGINKCVILGKLIGEMLPKDDIPQIFQDVINEAILLSNS